MKKKERKKKAIGIHVGTEKIVLLQQQQQKSDCIVDKQMINHLQSSFWRSLHLLDSLVHTS